jgi:hypothetical protein
MSSIVQKPSKIGSLVSPLRVGKNPLQVRTALVNIFGKNGEMGGLAPFRRYLIENLGGIDVLFLRQASKEGIVGAVGQELGADDG